MFGISKLNPYLFGRWTSTKCMKGAITRSITPRTLILLGEVSLFLFLICYEVPRSEQPHKISNSLRSRTGPDKFTTVNLSIVQLVT